MIPAVNFLYIARKSIRGGEEAGPPSSGDPPLRLS